MTLANTQTHRAAFLKKGIGLLALMIVIAAGFYLVGHTIYLAAQGENKALWLLLSFTAVIALLAWFLKRFWVLALDDRDVLDIFKIASINNKANLAHFQREFFQHSRIVTERGYSYTIRDGGTDIRTSLVYLGKEFPDRKTIIGEQALLTIALRAEQPFKMAIVNPQADIRESLDVEFYAPAVFSAKKYSYQKYGIVFSDYDKESIDAVFDNPFIHTQMIELFQRYQFKFAIFDDRKALAVKSASVETIAEDAEAYPVLMSISQLISNRQQKTTDQ